MNVAITTVDNPYDPLNDFVNWFKFDSVYHTIDGYNTCGLLALFANTSDMFSDYENKLEISHAIDKVIAINPTLYRAITDKDSS